MQEPLTLREVLSVLSKSSPYAVPTELRHKSQSLVDEMQSRYVKFKVQGVRSAPFYNENVSVQGCIPWWVLVLGEQGAKVFNSKGDTYLKSEGKLVRIECDRVSLGII